jgi:hypothetical protein
MRMIPENPIVRRQDRQRRFKSIEKVNDYNDQS